MHDKSLDILSINETRLDGSVDNNSIQLEGYNLVRKNRFREGGGVATYFRDHLNVKERAEKQNKRTRRLSASLYGNQA